MYCDAADHLTKVPRKNPIMFLYGIENFYGIFYGNFMVWKFYGIEIFD